MNIKQSLEMDNVRRLLVVDDDADLRDQLSIALEKAFECEVIQAAGGHEAMRMLAERSFDIIISDFCMPEGDGLELMMGLRKLNLKIKLIIFSGTPDVFASFIGIRPLVAVIPKPGFQELVSCVQEHLRETA